MVDPVAVIGALFGAGGLVAAAYSIYNQKKSQERLDEVQEHTDRVQERLERKEDLKATAETLGKIVSVLNQIESLVTQPESHEDVYLELRDLGRDILAFQHATGDVPVVWLDGIDTGGEDPIRINEPDQALEIAKTTNHSILFRLRIGKGDYSELDLSQSYLIWDAISYLNIGYGALGQLSEDHGDIIQEFDPNLADDIIDTMDEIFCGMMGRAIENRDGTTFDPREFENPNDISEGVLNYFIYYDGIEEDIRNLSALIDRTDDLRRNIVQTSYT